MNLRTGLVCTLVALGVLTARPARAQEAPVLAPGALWLDSEGTPPEGLRNPTRVEVPGDEGLLIAGGVTLGLSYIASFIPALLVAPRGYYSYELGYVDSPCTDGAIGVSFIPVLGPWLYLAVTDQCQLPRELAYYNSDGAVAYLSRGAGIDVPVDDDEAIYFTVMGVAQAVGLTAIVLGLLGTHTEIRFESGDASLSFDPLSLSARGRF